MRKRRNPEAMVVLKWMHLGISGKVNVRSKFVKGHHRGARKHAVTLGPNTCEYTSNKPKLLGYQCSHVLRKAAKQNISVENYISPEFNTDLFNT